MLDIEELNKPIQLLIHYATGLPLNRILKGNQAESSPRDLFCTYTAQPEGVKYAPSMNQKLVPAQDCDIPNWEDVEVEYVQAVKVRVSIQFFRDGAKDAAWKMGHSNWRNSVSEHLLRNELWWSGASTPNNLTDLEQAEFRQRYQLDVRLVVAGRIKEIILVANSIAGNIDDENGNDLADGDTSETT